MSAKERARQVREEKKKLKLLIDVEEIERHVCLNLAELCLRETFLFRLPEYSAALNKEGKSSSALERDFERWKKAVRSLLGLELVIGDRGYYEAPRGWATPRVSKVQARVKAMEAAQGAIRKPKKRKLDEPIKGVFKRLGIGYSGQKAKAWAKKGMPLASKKRGKRTFYYSDTGAVEEWLEGAIAEGLIQDPFQVKLPVEEARPRLQAAVRSLREAGVAQTQIARLAGATPPALESYVNDRVVNLKFIPAEVVQRVEDLAKDPPKVRRKKAREGAPSLRVVEEALRSSGGNASAASRQLASQGYTFVSPATIADLARRYDLPLRDRSVVRPPCDELKKVLVDSGYRISAVAEAFGFSDPVARSAIAECGLTALVERFGIGSIRREDLVEAAEASGFSTPAAAELLEISPSHFRSLLRRDELIEWYDGAVAERERSERERQAAELAAAIERGVAEDLTREELAQAIGVPRTTLDSQVKIHGLEPLYAGLAQRRAFQGERLREIAPDEVRVPFWLAALRDLRAESPGRGGGRKLARRLGAGNATVTNWLRGKRVPSYAMIETIMKEARRPMPNWRGALDRIVEDHGGNKAAAARSLGFRSINNVLSGRVNPSEKMLERILGEDFWVIARREPESGDRPGAGMGEVPPDVAASHLSKAMADLLGTVRSQRELGRLLGISPPQVSRFLRKVTASPKPEVRDRIVALYRERFGRDPEGLVGTADSAELLKRALTLFPTQTALAEEIGVTRSQLSRIKTGKTTISPRIHMRLEQLLRDVQENPPRFRVRSPEQGLRVIRHPDITSNYEKALRWKPKHKKAVLVPCAQTKPFPDAPSHRDGYMAALAGKKRDVFVVSEPLGVVPYSWSRDYPQADYDFPPAHLRGRAHDVLAGRITRWLKEVGPKYQEIVLALPRHHAKLVDKALDMLGYEPTKLVWAGIGECLDAGACPPGHYRPNSRAYRKYLKARTNPPEEDLGDCYDAAFDFMVEKNQFRDGDPSMRLVHATVIGQGPIEGVPHGHAWVEVDLAPGARVAIDRSLGRDIQLPAIVYRHIGRAHDVREYTWKEVREMTSKHGHVGPWPESNPPKRSSVDRLIEELRDDPIQMIRVAGLVRELREEGVPEGQIPQMVMRELRPPKKPTGPRTGGVGKVSGTYTSAEERRRQAQQEAERYREGRRLQHNAGAPGYQSHAWISRDWRSILRKGKKLDYSKKCGAKGTRLKGGKPALCLPFAVIEELQSSKEGRKILLAQVKKKEKAKKGQRVPYHPLIAELVREDAAKAPRDRRVAGNPFGMTAGQIAGKVVGWTATGAVADLITSRINDWITTPITEAAEKTITETGRRVIGANPQHPRAFLGRDREPVEVLRPAYGKHDYSWWDVRYEDGEEVTVPVYDLFTATGFPWSPVPQRRTARGPYGLGRNPSCGYDRVSFSDYEGKGDSKRTAVFEGPRGQRTVHFGHVDYEDYTTHHDPSRKERYLTRHRTGQDWDRCDTAGALSRWVLWGPSTSRAENERHFRRRFGINPHDNLGRWYDLDLQVDEGPDLRGEALDYVLGWVDHYSRVPTEVRARAGAPLRADDVYLAPWWGSLEARRREPGRVELMEGWLVGGDPAALRWTVQRYQPGARTFGAEQPVYQLEEAVDRFAQLVGPQGLERALEAADRRLVAANPLLEGELAMTPRLMVASNPCPVCVGAVVTGAYAAYKAAR